jgi:hypothetical protein
MAQRVLGQRSNLSGEYDISRSACEVEILIYEIFILRTPADTLDLGIVVPF